jgi:hypothetical protein
MSCKAFGSARQQCRLPRPADAADRGGASLTINSVLLTADSRLDGPVTTLNGFGALTATSSSVPSRSCLPIGGSIASTSHRPGLGQRHGKPRGDTSSTRRDVGTSGRSWRGCAAMPPPIPPGKKPRPRSRAIEDARDEIFVT